MSRIYNVSGTGKLCERLLASSNKYANVIEEYLYSKSAVRWNCCNFANFVFYWNYHFK